MNKIRNMVIAFVVFYAIVILISNAWIGVRDSYGITEQDTDSSGKNVFIRLSEINLIAGISDLTSGIQKLTKIGGFTDLLGGLAIAASGTLQIIGGIVTFPIEIFGAITNFYGDIIPPIVTQILGFIVTIAVGFILLSAKLGFEL